MEPILLDVPDELRTARLWLRVPRVGDGALVLPAVRASINELHEWMPWAKHDYSEADAELWCRRSAIEFAERKAIQMLMFRNEQHIGTLGAFDINLKVLSCEIGYWIRTECSGHGYVTEAVEGLGAFAARHLNIHRIQIKCDTRNERSAAVARRCGYVLDGTMRRDALDPRGLPRDTHVFSRLYGND